MYRILRPLSLDTPKHSYIFPAEWRPTFPKKQHPWYTSVPRVDGPAQHNDKHTSLSNQVHVGHLLWVWLFSKPQSSSRQLGTLYSCSKEFMICHVVAVWYILGQCMCPKRDSHVAAKDGLCAISSPTVYKWQSPTTDLHAFTQQKTLMKDANVIRK